MGLINLCQRTLRDRIGAKRRILNKVVTFVFDFWNPSRNTVLRRASDMKQSSHTVTSINKVQPTVAPHDDDRSRKASMLSDVLGAQSQPFLCGFEL
jgi:hypothetical protein